MTAAPDLMMAGGMKQFEDRAGALTPQQRKAVDAWLPTLKASAGHRRRVEPAARGRWAWRSTSST